ncbi:hypothetical protein Taro_035482 [Colocasia esculenta]|uniref:Uncharacterized protein n=1 Tax=Colocasia esculenta TaxID=4460 RepID=A0A843W5V1_COLES|nr:hypothetical protein [Colocasia esculenta]
MEHAKVVTELVVIPFEAVEKELRRHSRRWRRCLRRGSSSGGLSLCTSEASRMASFGISLACMALRPGKRSDSCGNHLVNIEKMKAGRLLNWLKPQYITQLTPLDIQTYAEMVKKTQLLKDATEIVDKIRGRIVKKEQVDSPGNFKPTNGKKRPINEGERINTEKKLRVDDPIVSPKEIYKYCDKKGHKIAKCWKKVGACLRCRSKDHKMYECLPMQKQTLNDKHQDGPKQQGKLRALKGLETMEEGGKPTHTVVGRLPGRVEATGEEDLVMAPKKGSSDDIGWQHGTIFTGQGVGVSRLKKHLTGKVRRIRKSGRIGFFLIRHDSPESGRFTWESVQFNGNRANREKRARAHSRAEAWEVDQRAAYRVSLQIAQHEVGSGSGSGVGGADGSQSRRFSNVGDYFTRPPVTQEHGRQNKRPAGSSTHVAAPSQSRRPPTSSQLVKGKQIAQESRPKKTGAAESRPTKGIVIREPPPPVQKKKDWLSGWRSKKGKKGATLVEDPLDIADTESLDPNAEDDTPSPLDSPRLPNSASHDSMTIGGPSSDDGGGGGGNTPQGGEGGDSGQGGGGGGIAFTKEQFFRGATQNVNHSAPLQYNRR